MRQYCYAYFDGVFYDNRGAAGEVELPGLAEGAISQFNPGNPIEVFVSDRGFVVLAKGADLYGALWAYSEKVAALSCGKCTPCRIGSQIVARAFEKAARGAGFDLEYVGRVARQMRQTSLCGIGQTGVEALIGAIEHVPEVFAHPSRTKAENFFALDTAPCIEACPAHVRVPDYIDAIKEGSAQKAEAVLLEHYPLIGSCGRVCVRYCEKACRRAAVDAPVNIKNLKRYAADAAGPAESLLEGVEPVGFKPGFKVAVVGAGPAGINCAYHLLRKGYATDIYETHGHAGGMALAGIPPYRLPKGLLSQEASLIEKLGGRYFFKKTLGRDFTIDSLFREGYNAVFLGIGCSRGQLLGLEGEQDIASGYYNGIDFLYRVEHLVEYGHPFELQGDVVVVGCGNVAMDCARSAARITDGRVHVVYRRSRAAAPADPEEIQAAIDEGVEFHFLSLQEEILAEGGKVTGLKLSRLKEIPVEGSRRGKLEKIEDSAFSISCSTVIAAIGQKIDEETLAGESGIAFGKKGNIAVTASMQTTRPGVFAGGDAATGPTTLIDGMAQGQRAAESIDEYLTRGSAGFTASLAMSEMIARGGLLAESGCGLEVLAKPRTEVPTIEPSERRNFREVETGFDKVQAAREASRCMRCMRVLSVATTHPIPGVKEA